MGAVGPGWLTPRRALAAYALLWTVGALLLLAAWRSAVAEDRIRTAPICSESQIFTSTECRITLDATMTSLTSTRAELDVGERHVSAAVRLAGPTSGASGVPVRVTIYRGQPIHVEGSKFNFDTEASPTTQREDFLNFGLVVLIGGNVLVSINLLIGHGRTTRVSHS
jgi:hypothetical protein